jgi:hypothetical protein
MGNMALDLWKDVADKTRDLRTITAERAEYKGELSTARCTLNAVARAQLTNTLPAAVA